jgi:hypothetical protein
MMHLSERQKRIGAPDGLCGARGELSGRGSTTGKKTSDVTYYLPVLLAFNIAKVARHVEEHPPAQKRRTGNYADRFIKKRFDRHMELAGNLEELPCQNAIEPVFIPLDLPVTHANLSSKFPLGQAEQNAAFADATANMLINLGETASLRLGHPNTHTHRARVEGRTNQIQPWRGG